MDLSDIDFNALEFEEIGSWPLVIRVGAIIAGCLVAMGATYFFVVDKQIKKFNKQVKNEVQLREDFRGKYNKAANLTEYEQQKVELEKTYRQMLRQLPPEALVAQLVEDISQEASVAGLTYKLIKPGEEEKGDEAFYTELAIDLTMLGTYHGFGEFVASISRLPRIVTLHDFTIKRRPLSEQDDGGGELVMDIQARTYWTSEGGES